MNISEKPRMAFSGVRSSWLITARNSLFARFAASASSSSARITFVLMLDDLLRDVVVADMRLEDVAREQADRRRHAEEEIVAEIVVRADRIDEQADDLIARDRCVERHHHRIGKAQAQQAAAIDHDHDEAGIVLALSGALSTAVISTTPKPAAPIAMVNAGCT